MLPLFTELQAFVNQHEAVLGLLALAFIVCMPDQLPVSFRMIPGWLYGWLHTGLKTFVSFRSPTAPKDKA